MTAPTEASAAATPARHVRAHPRWVYLAVAAATGCWFVLQLAAGVRQNDHTYPVTGYAMFSYPSDGVDVRLELEGTSADRSGIAIEPADLGLTPLQLRAYLARNVGPAADEVSPEATERLAELGDVWSERQDATLDRLTLWRVERSLDDGTPRAQEVITWRR